MKKPIFAAVIVIVMIVGIWLALSQNKAADQLPKKAIPVNNETIDNDSNDKTADNSFTGTINDLLAKKAALKCSTAYSVEDGLQSQVIYSDGKSLRVDMTVNFDGKEIKSYAIATGGWEYLWSDINLEGAPAAKSGIKVKFTELDKSGQNTQPAPAGRGIDTAKSLDFSCQPWVVDSAMFVVPSNIEFSDVTVEAQDMLDNAPKNACDICKNIPVEAREMCEQGCKGNADDSASE